MDADFVSGCGGNEHARNCQAEQFERKIRVVTPAYQPCCQGADDPEHHGKVDSESEETAWERCGAPGFPDERQGNRQETPCHHIIDSGAKNGCRAKRRRLKIALLQNPSQYREGRNTHGNSEEKHKRDAADTLRGETNPQRMREQSTHGKWQQDAHAAGSNGSRSLPVKLTVVEFHSHQEQEENQPDCRKRLEWREG
jgi:hypothetical protein